jgi:hypothetical protein
VTEDRIYIEDLARKPAANGQPASTGLLDRAAHTIRQWVNQGLLPEHLAPAREGGRQRMYWTREQIPGLREFAEEREGRRGWQH